MTGDVSTRPRVELALVNGRIVLPDEIVEGRALVIAGGEISGIVEPETLAASVERFDVGGCYITPGLIDIHIHGARGHTFNEPTKEAFDKITATCAARGVTSVLATVATAPVTDLVEVLRFADWWMRSAGNGATVLGVHLEGPYFSMEQRGAQDPRHLRIPDDGTVDALLEHHSVLRMMSFAPELPGALELTKRLVELGVVPAAGHSSARDEEVEAAVRAGVRHAIHMWSGQSTTMREGPWRRPGLLEASLAMEELTGEVIADNRHLPKTLLQLAYRCLGPNRLCVISDATSGAGLPEGSRFRMGGMEYEVHDGVGMMFDRTAFAGSTTLLNEMIPVLTQVADIPLVEAVRMATLTPARVIGVEGRKGSLEPGKEADVAIFDAGFVPQRVMIGGKWVYEGCSASG
jgi:N-acetylglucosamine-6-phosphate deacetylase